MNTEYFECDCCGLMTKDEDCWLSPLHKDQDVCGACRQIQLEIKEERNQCGCLAGCNDCLMLER